MLVSPQTVSNGQHSLMVVELFVRRFQGIAETRGGLMDVPRAGRVGCDTNYKPRSTSYS